MANIFEIPLLNPLRFVWQSDKLPSDIVGTKYKAFNPSYNYTQFDDDLAYKSLKFFESKEEFIQPYQQSEILRGQFFGSDTTTSNYTVRLLDENDNVFTAKSIAIVQQAGTYLGRKLYTFQTALFDIPEGIYRVQLRYNHGSSQYSYILSERINIKQRHAKSVRFEYTNSYNDQDMMYLSASFLYHLRLNGSLIQFTPNSSTTTYEDQPKNMKVVSGIAFRNFELSLFQIPDWMADKIERMFICDTITIDGKRWCRDSGAKLETKDSIQTPLKDYTIKLREAENQASISHNLNSAIMGDMPQTKYFWIEQMSIDNVVTTIRQGFNGKQNFLDYLNTNQKVGSGYWAEDAKNQLVFYANDDFVITGSWVLTSVNILKYGMKLTIDGAGDIEWDVTASGVTCYYAAKWGNGVIDTNKTALTASPTATAIINTWTNNGIWECYVYFSDYVSIADTASTVNVKSIDIDIAPSCTYFNIFSTAGRCNRFESNPFNYVTALDYFNIAGMALSSYAIDDILRWAYDNLSRLATSCEFIVSGQAVSAPPSRNFRGMSAIIAAIGKRITTLTTD